MDYNDSADGVAVRPAPLPDSGLGRRWFQRPNPGGGIQGTQVQADLLNDVQGSLIEVLTAAGLTPVRGDDAQVRSAIQILASAITTAHAIQISTETLAGHLEVATPAEARALSNNGRAMTPDNLEHGFRTGLGASSVADVGALAGSGPSADFFSAYFQAPGGFTLQYGISEWAFESRSVAFPITWTANLFVPLMVSLWPSMVGTPNFGLSSLASTGFDWTASNYNGRIVWAAVGLAPLVA